jgi:hypothetical protein
MPSLRQKCISLILLCAIIAGVFPVYGSSASSIKRSMDDALLLALASHEQLEQGLEEPLSGNSVGSYYLMPAAMPSAAGKNNPHGHLAGMYARFAQTQSAGSTTREYFEEKAIEHVLLSQALTDARAQRDRRRGRGFQRFIRGLARAPVNITRGVAKGVGSLLKGTFRVVGTVLVIAAEQIPEIARDIVKQKLRELRDLAQGKIELTWDKLAGKLGAPFAVWLRSKVDPAFVRLRDRFVARVLGNRKEKTSEEDENEGLSGDEVSQEIDEEHADEEPAYGNHRVVVEDPEGNFGYFTWKEYWTGLPENELVWCQWLNEPTGDAEAYLHDFAMELEFELDSGKLKGTFAHEGEFDITYQVSEWAIVGVIEDGWVKPSPNATGWVFGGSATVEITMHDRWRCFHCVPVEGGCGDILVEWLDDERTKEVHAAVDGSTDQVIPGEGDEPDRLAPGGKYTVTIVYEGSDAEMIVECSDCALTADFPPPVYFGD